MPGWSRKENLCLGQAGTEQVIISRKSCDSVTKHDKGEEKQSMTSAGMEITSATAWGCLLSYHLIALPGRGEGHSSFSLQFHFVSLFLSSISFFSFLPHFFPLLCLLPPLPLAIFHDIFCFFFLLLMHLSGSLPFTFSAFLFPSLAFCTTLWKATSFESCLFHYPALAPGSNRVQLEQSQKWYFLMPCSLPETLQASCSFCFFHPWNRERLKKVFIGTTSY